MRKDKQKVIGETFSEEHLRAMLEELTDYADRSDFDILERAYRGMKPDNFKTFLSLFKEKGHEITAKNDRGQTLTDAIANHRHANEYIAALKAAL